MTNWYRPWEACEKVTVSLQEQKGRPRRYSISALPGELDLCLL